MASGVTAAALMADRLAADLLAPRQDLANLPNAVAAARFTASLAGDLSLLVRRCHSVIF